MTSDTEQNCFHAIIKGRVQGVGYRMFAREAAVRLGLTGWVRNLADGQVEVHAEGSETTLTEYLTELSKGPPWSHVADIQVNWHEMEEKSEKFRILR